VAEARPGDRMPRGGPLRGCAMNKPQTFGSYDEFCREMRRILLADGREDEAPPLSPRLRDLGIIAAAFLMIAAVCLVLFVVFMFRNGVVPG